VVHLDSALMTKGLFELCGRYLDVRESQSSRMASP
jgi:hypothetical protein